MNNSILDKTAYQEIKTSFTLSPIDVPLVEASVPAVVSPEVAPVDEEEQARLRAESMARISKLTDVDLHELAWDLVLYGDDADRVLAANDLTRADYEVLKTLPVFMQESENARKQLKEDPHAPLRKLARAYLFTRIGTLNDVAVDDMVEPAVRVRAIEAMAKMAGVYTENKDNKQIATAVHINFGGQLGAELAS